MSESAAASYILPMALIGRADLARLGREVEALDNELEAQKVRGLKDQGYHLPTMSRGLSDFIEQNKIDISNDQTRLELKEQLRVLKDKAPIMHMTFAVDADPDFLQQLVLWLRHEIHPQALISVGLQPDLVAGVYIRTPNHVHDFSVRSLLQDKHDLLIQKLESYSA